MINYTQVCLNSFGYTLPPRVLTSEQIEQQLLPVYQKLKLPQGRLELMSGIQQRRFWDEGTRPSEAAAMAGEVALQRAGISPAEIDCLIFTSVCRDMMEPASASFVHERLGLGNNCMIFDISNACLGFLDGMVVLANMIELGQVQNGLVVSGETAEDLLSSTLNSLLTDATLSRKTIKPAFASLTIGSGSMALHMKKSTGTPGEILLQCGAWQANTQYANLCHGGQGEKAGTLMETNSEELLHRGVETAQKTWRIFSDTSGWSADTIDCFFCHQVGSAHAKLLFDRLELDPARNYETLAQLGNVGSVSAPITMAMAIEDEVFTPGCKGALLGIGSGINCLMLGVEWMV